MATVKHGVVTMVTKGVALVRASDVKNPLHYDESEVCSCYGIINGYYGDVYIRYM